MATLAIIRPDDWNLPLFVHVLGAMALVGTLMIVANALFAAGRDGDDRTPLTRFGFKALILGVVPSYIVMRVGAQWVEAAEDLTEEQQDSAWIGIGYVTADIGAVLILASVVLAVIGLRRPPGARFARTIAVIATLLVVAYLVAVWAMTVKPD